MLNISVSIMLDVFWRAVPKNAKLRTLLSSAGLLFIASIRWAARQDEMLASTVALTCPCSPFKCSSIRARFIMRTRLLLLLPLLLVGNEMMIELCPRAALRMNFCQTFARSFNARSAHFRNISRWPVLAGAWHWRPPLKCAPFASLK